MEIESLENRQAINKETSKETSKERRFNHGFAAWIGLKAVIAYEAALAAEVGLARMDNRIVSSEVLVNAQYGVLATAVALGLLAGVVCRNRT